MVELLNDPQMRIELKAAIRWAIPVGFLVMAAVGLAVASYEAWTARTTRGGSR
jgi:hypothetical protein